MAMSRKTQFGAIALALAAGWVTPASARAQVAQSYAAATPAIVRDYVVGPQDVLNITSQDDPALSGKFTVEADLTFTFPLIGRVRAGGLTLREVESQLQAKLVDEGFFKDPQIRVSIEQYKSQKVFIVGEVRSPGAYALSGDMRLVEALALAGSTLPTAAGEVVIVPAGADSMLVRPASADEAKAEGSSVVRVNLRELQNGAFQQNVQLSGGDTVFVLKAENIYVFGQVKNPGAYPLQQDVTTVLQGLALAGGVTERGATSRVEIVRVVNGEQKKIKVKLEEQVLPGDTIVVPQRFF
jgi:polysaccharide export outer membrane protein